MENEIGQFVELERGVGINEISRFMGNWQDWAEGVRIAIEWNRHSRCEIKKVSLSELIFFKQQLTVNTSPMEEFFTPR